ncbi:spore coat protein [Bacillus safensis]|uniref:spore coat protein n=1 Tax=Bacillus safensis TaxID=561879 RepID=UPI00203ECC89|nr:spore coat protein [Bacillus safensis]MCM3025437.1 spore coat protein [Bacillus safensis]
MNYFDTPPVIEEDMRRPFGFGRPGFGFGRPGFGFGPPGFGFGRPGFGFGRPGFFGPPFLGGFAGGLLAGSLLAPGYGYGYPYPPYPPYGPYPWY